MKNIGLDENEIIDMLSDTCDLAASYKVDQMTYSALAAKESGVLTDQVEFLNWLGRNYSNAGMFDSTEAIQEYMSRGVGKEAWVLQK